MSPARHLLPAMLSATGCACGSRHWKEALSVLWLDNQHRLLAHDTLFLGAINSITVHPREVVKSGLKNNAAAAVLAHNHPSGKLNPVRPTG